MPTDSPVDVRVKKVLIDHLGVDDAQVVTDASICDDLGGDSLDVVEILMAVEEEFHVEIADDETEDVETVGDWIKLVERKLAEKAGA